MNLFHALIFGIVEGITEFLPISSTGHLMLTARVLGLSQSEFLKTFEIVIQFGAILSVIVLYWRTLLVNTEALKRVVLAFLPTAALGLIFYKIIKHFLMGSNQVVLWSMFIGGVFLIVFELFHNSIKHHSFISFGVYRIILALSFWLLSGTTVLI